ncbi:hypothetical protein HMN09_00799600 [Mycena chlorophos]|uniref:Uncharacterized protein n=1 Tax=Mycena chlorophos TaxID=658473 RepID=A0A8H6WAN6_MYCCL|nr:hypothetical protein HMN09_00799600 [Mycena chlorophos]
MAPSSIVFGYLLATILEAALFGLYTVLFVTVLYLFQSRERRPPQVVLIGLVVQLLALLGHWTNTFYRALHGIGHLDSDAATAYFSSLSPSFSLGVMFSGFVTLATDAVMIHRVYVVFSRRIAPVVLPLALLLGQFVVGLGAAYFLLKSSSGEELGNLAILWSPWVIAYWGISIAISIHTTGEPLALYNAAAYRPTRAMIMIKLLRLRKAFPTDALFNRKASEGRIPFGAVCANIAECAALQTATLIALSITYCLGSVAQIVFMEVTPVILGISTVLIYARVGLGWSHSEDPTTQTVTAVRFAPTLSAVSRSDSRSIEGLEMDRSHTTTMAGSK